VSATGAPVSDYLDKPFTMERLAEVVDRALRPAPRDPAAAARRVPEPSLELIGDSEAIARVRALVRHLAESDVRTLLVTGESGTGKELVARLFHAQGPRRSGPFVEVNCAAIAESLFESEFFGHERGAFTGAVASRRGLAELADGGTLFLDEIGDLPRAGQAKLLRFLEDQGFYRVGGSRKVQVDTRIVAATNGDLRAMVEQQTFRADLYFRLAVAAIELTPLRRRPEDIVPLARFWLAEAGARYGKQVTGFAPEAELLLQQHPWPGNVRELRNTIERLVLFCPGPRITARQLQGEQVGPAAVTADPAWAASTPMEPLAAIERAHIRSVLDRVRGNKTRAAEILGISRQTLRAKLGAS
jgi:DNA-binding NtrC family response regulator